MAFEIESLIIDAPKSHVGRSRGAKSEDVLSLGEDASSSAQSSIAHGPKLETSPDPTTAGFPLEEPTFLIKDAGAEILEEGLGSQGGQLRRYREGTREK